MAQKTVTQNELRRAFNMALYNNRSTKTKAYHREIAKRLNAGAKVEAGGAFTVKALGESELHLERHYQINVGIHLILAKQIVDQEIRLLETAARNIEKAFLNRMRRNHLQDPRRPAVVRTGRSAADERQYIADIRRDGFREATAKKPRKQIKRGGDE